MSSCSQQSSGLKRYLNFHMKAKGDCGWKIHLHKYKVFCFLVFLKVSFSSGINEPEYFYNVRQKLVGTNC